MTPARRTSAIGLLAIVTGACAPEAASSEGAAVTDLYRIFIYVAAGIFVVVAGLIAWSIVAYRDRGGRDDPPQVHTNVRLEILWFAIPTVIVAYLFIISVGVTDRVNEPNDPAGAVTIEVDAFQWGCTFTYGDQGAITSLPDETAEIVVPVDTPVTFILNSDDVIHSFYVPRFLIKRDVVPGQTNRIDVVIEEPGSYGGVCAEFCGLLHDSMDFTLDAVPPADFERWLATLSEGTNG